MSVDETKVSHLGREVNAVAAIAAATEYTQIHLRSVCHTNTTQCRVAA